MTMSICDDCKHKTIDLISPYCRYAQTQIVWCPHRTLPIPQVQENLEERLNKLEKRVAELVAKLETNSKQLIAGRRRFSALKE